jgi:hypothetical protein
MPAPPEQPVKIAGQRRESDQLPERVAVRVRPLQHLLACSPAVLPGQRAGLLGQVFVCLAEAILVSVEGVVERPEQAGFKDARDDQPALDVEEVFLALAQAMHAAERTHHCSRPQMNIGVMVRRTGMPATEARRDCRQELMANDAQHSVLA